MQRSTSDDPSPISLRPAAPEDIPAVLDLWSVAGEIVGTVIAACAAMGYGPQDDWTRWVRPASD